MNLAELITKHRGGRLVSAAADLAGVSRRSLTGWERGGKVPSVRSLARLIDGWEISVSAANVLWREHAKAARSTVTVEVSDV